MKAAVRRVLVLLMFVVLAAVAGGLLWVRQLVRDSPERLPEWAQRRPSIYLTLALKHIRDEVITTGAVDWDGLAARARERARDAQSTADTHPAIQAALAEVGEDAGLVEPPADETEAQGAYGLQALFPERIVAAVYPRSPADAAGLRPGDVIERVDGREPVALGDRRARGRFVDLPRPRVTLRVRRGDQPAVDIPLAIGAYQSLPAHAGRVGSDLGFVSMPAVTGDEAFVRQVREAIVAADGPAVCGWVIDLRRNNGGAFWPVLLALRPIIGDGPLGAWTDRAGQRAAWEYPTPAAPPAVSHPQPGIAVLTSRLTANAGEMASIAFRGHPRARVFGEPTWGSSANRTRVRLPDGATLVLASALATDRAGRTYAGRIPPDELAPIDWSRIGAPDDAAVMAAATWLRSTESCRRR